MLRNSCFCWVWCFSPGWKTHTGAHVAISVQCVVRGKHNLTLTPWMISQVGLAWKRGDKKWEGGGGSEAQSWILSLEGMRVCVCVDTWTGQVCVGEWQGSCEYVCAYIKYVLDIRLPATSQTHRHRHTHTHLQPCAHNVHFIDHPAHVTETINASYIMWCSYGNTHSSLVFQTCSGFDLGFQIFFWSPRASQNVHPSMWLTPKPTKFLHHVSSERLACVQVSPSAAVCQLVCLCWHLNQNNYRLPQLCVTMATFPSSHQSYLWW